MNKVIIYKQDAGIAVLHVNQDCGLTIEQIAKKDVPTGVSYCIIDAADIPQDRTFRAAWDADFTTFDGVGE